jgi:hypothetical protein
MTLAYRLGVGDLVLVFAGAAIGWASGTVTSYAYPPPSRGLQRRSSNRAQPQVVP